jgi:hypothetical protein
MFTGEEVIKSSQDLDKLLNETTDKELLERKRQELYKTLDQAEINALVEERKKTKG